MRFVLYNIRYGTGGPPLLFPWSGYLRRTGANLADIIAFLHGLDPDLIGLIEVDAGSFRADRRNQAQTIADALGRYHTYRSKYGENHLWQRLPVFNKQGNAFVTRNSIRHELFHYFDRGVKRLAIELQLEDLTVFLVHLALNFRIRHRQLGDLYHLVKSARRPLVVAGDFNAFWGDREIALFLAATGLVSAGPDAQPTYPSWKPRRQLDFILHSPEITVNRFWMPAVTLSDHLPLVCDFDLPTA